MNMNEFSCSIDDDAQSYQWRQSYRLKDGRCREDAITGKPHAYFNMALFSCPPQDLYSEFEDLHECLDIGHMNQASWSFT